MSRTIFYLLIIFLSFTGKAQISPQPIKINNINYPIEFSAMAWKGYDTLIILPEEKRNVFYYAIKSEIEACLNNNNTTLNLDTIAVTGLDIFGTRHTDYDGIEACIIQGNTVYICIEANQKNCYILKGEFTGNTVVFDEKSSVTLQKPNGSDKNDGFESLFPASDTMLITFFEKCISGTSRQGYKVDINRLALNSLIAENEIIYDYAREGRQRITEICRYDDTTFYGIDFLLRENKDDKSQPCFSKLVKLDIKENLIAIRYVTDLLYGTDKCTSANINCINFEGMVKLGDGLLVISDDVVSDDSCTHFYYYKFK